MTTDVGVLDRATYLGSSDIAAILGLSPWKTPVDVYFEKRGQAQPIDAAKQKLFNRGKRMEPVILDMLSDEYDIDIVARGQRYRDPEHAWMAAEIDAEAIDIDNGERFNIEAKSVHQFAAGQFGEGGTDQIPIHYAAQCMFGLMVTGRQRCTVAALVGSDNISVYHLERDEETIAGIRSKAIAFWRDHVLTGIPPEPIVLDDVYRLMRRDADITAEAPDDIAQHIREFELAKQKAKAESERADDLKFQIGRWLLGEVAMDKPTRKPKHVITYNGAPLLTIGYQEQTRIDTDAIRKRHPEIAAECSKTTTFFRFDSPRKGKRK
jgi:putative phage-type endonuclease